MTQEILGGFLCSVDYLVQIYGKKEIKRTFLLPTHILPLKNNRLPQSIGDTILHINASIK